MGFPVDRTAHAFKSRDGVHQKLDVRALVCGQCFRFLSQLTVYYYYCVFSGLLLLCTCLISHSLSFVSSKRWKDKNCSLMGFKSDSLFSQTDYMKITNSWIVIGVIRKVTKVCYLKLVAQIPKWHPTCWLTTLISPLPPSTIPNPSRVVFSDKHRVSFLR
jgi:hypothetical protein